MPASADFLDLPAPDDMARQLAAHLPAFGQVRWLASTGSTNADLLAQARTDTATAKPWLQGVHLQESGRGRAGRAWQGRIGATLMCSWAFDVQVPAAVLASLSPLAGLAVCEALRGLAGSRAGDLQVKWPNDVQWRDAKLAGILVETTRNPAAPGYTAVFGVGVNLRDAAALSQALGREIADWEGIAAAGGATAGPVALASAIARSLQVAVQAWQAQGFGGFITRYAQVDALRSRAVNVLDQGTVLRQGIAQGVDEHGRLQLATADGIEPVTVGEISVRLQ